MDWLLAIIDSWNITWTKVFWVTGIFVVSFVGSLLLVGFILIKLPAHYFCKNCPRGMWLDRHPALRWTALIGKNLLGLVLLVVGIIALFAPGQGVLTILIAIMLLDFPGKRRFERWIVSRPKVLRAINWLRRRYHKEPLMLDDEPREVAANDSTNGELTARKQASEPSGMT